MTAPQLAAQRFLYGCLVGVVLGAVYGFLRPLRPKRTTLSDLIFLLCTLYGWLFLHFGLCGADVRIAYSLAMGLGGLAWELSLGLILRPFFSVIWNCLGKIWAFITLPLKKISKMTKILFASGQ